MAKIKATNVINLLALLPALLAAAGPIVKAVRAVLKGKAAQ